MHSDRVNLIAAATQLMADTGEQAVQQVLELGGAAPAAMALLHARPGLSLDELRRPLALSQPGGVRLVDRLEARAWVERRQGDGRRLALYLTPAGRQLVQQTLTQRGNALDALVRPLSEAEQTELVRLLEKILVAHVVEAGDRERVCRLCSRNQCVSCPLAAAAGTALERDRRLSELDLELRLDEGDASQQELTRLLADAERASDQPAAAKAQARLGAVAMARGDYDEVINRLEEARPYLSPISDALAVATLARAYTVSGKADEAVGLLQDALIEIDERAPANAIVWVRFAVYLSYALTDGGRYAEARNILRQAVWRSKGVQDFYTRARVHWAAGRLAMFERELRSAGDRLRGSRPGDRLRAQGRRSARRQRRGRTWRGARHPRTGAGRSRRPRWCGCRVRRGGRGAPRPTRVVRRRRGCASVVRSARRGRAHSRGRAGARDRRPANGRSRGGLAANAAAISSAARGGDLTPDCVSGASLAALA